ncbi:hypothetical protein ACP4OV_020887 [Aristida adscensionis]
MMMTMSCSPRHDGDDGRRPALDLLDEYWFFSNTLAKSSTSSSNADGAGAGAAARRPPPPPPPRSPCTSVAATKQAHEQPQRRRLLRTPSLPSPRVERPKDDDLVEEEEEEDSAACAAGNNQQQEAAAPEVDDDDLNWSSIYEGVLRTRMAEEARRSSPLHRAPSMPVPSSAAMERHGSSTATKSTPSMPRLRHSYSTLGRHHHHHHHHTPITNQAEQTPPPARTTPGDQRRQPRREVRSFSANQQPAVARSKSALHDKKWKSSSDLESIEVQGFKDLGFVFDKEELRENLAVVLPGLRGGKVKAAGAGDGDSSGVRRPYLSEAWQHVERSAAAAAIRVQPDAAGMKDQLRMWAQAVACNVRQDC